MNAVLKSKEKDGLRKDGVATSMNWCRETGGKSHERNKTGEKNGKVE